MYNESKNYKNLPSNTRTFQAKGKNYFNREAGLKGVDREIAKSRLVIGRSMDLLVTKLERIGYDESAICKVIEEHLCTNSAFAAHCVRISRAYRPGRDQRDHLEFYYLISIPLPVLYEFIPHICLYFKDPSRGIGPNMWVSQNSIEVYVTLEGGQPKWRDLKFMSLDDVNNLPDLVARAGLPPAPQQIVQGRSNGQQSSGNQQVTPQQNEPQQGPHYDGQQAPYHDEQQPQYQQAPYYDEEQPQYQQAPYYDEEQPQYQQPQYQQAPYHDEEHSTTQRGVQQPPQGNAAQGHQNKQDGTNRVGKARDDCSNQPFDLGTIEFKI